MSPASDVNVAGAGNAVFGVAKASFDRAPMPLGLTPATL